MSTIDLIVNFFKQGGAFLYPIAAVFVIGLGVAVERFIYLTRVSFGNRRLWAELSPLIQAGNFRKAMEVAENTDSALSTIMRYGMSRVATARRRDDVEKAMEESLIEVIPRLEKRTHYLATLANIGMLMGLLGTVIGLIQAFAAVAAVNPGGEGEHALGQHLGGDEQHGARPRPRDHAAACHMYLETKTTELVDSLEVASIKFLNTVVEHRTRSPQTVTAAAQAASARPASPQGPRRRLPAGPHAHEEELCPRAAATAQPCALPRPQRPEYRADAGRDGHSHVLPDLHGRVLEDERARGAPAGPGRWPPTKRRASNSN